MRRIDITEGYDGRTGERIVNFSAWLRYIGPCAKNGFPEFAVVGYGREKRYVYFTAPNYKISGPATTTLRGSRGRKPQRRSPRLRVLFSSARNDYGTPDKLFAKYNAKYHFTVDVAASLTYHCCAYYYAKADDGACAGVNGLVQDWDGKVVWMNSPYGREIGKWMKKASEAKGGLVVCLVPARPDTRWWHEYVTKASEIIYLKGRITFKGSKNPAPFPSAIVIFRNS